MGKVWPEREREGEQVPKVMSSYRGKHQREGLEIVRSAGWCIDDTDYILGVQFHARAATASERESSVA